VLKESVATSRLHYNRAKDNYDEIVQFSLDISLYDDKEKYGWARSIILSGSVPRVGKAGKPPTSKHRAGGCEPKS